MPKVKNTREINYPVEDIYGLVVDVESYPKVLQFIRNIKIIEKAKDFMIAKVEVGLPVLTFSYNCKVTFKQNKFVKVNLISGPFKHLKASWEFEEIEKSKTRINYSLDSKFNNPLVEATAGAIFASQLNYSIKAFEEKLRNK